MPWRSPPNNIWWNKFYPSWLLFPDLEIGISFLPIVHQGKIYHPSRKPKLLFLLIPLTLSFSAPYPLTPPVFCSFSLSPHPLLLSYSCSLSPHHLLLFSFCSLSPHHLILFCSCSLSPHPFFYPFPAPYPVPLLCSVPVLYPFTYLMYSVPAPYPFTSRYFTDYATCSWLYLVYPWLSLPYPWLSLLQPCLSLLSPWLSLVSLAVPGLSLALHQLDKRILLSAFAVLVWPWLRQELNSIYRGLSKDWCWSTWLQLL